MTQDELDALPEIGGFDTQGVMRDGVLYAIPVARPNFVLGDMQFVTDVDGERWAVGRLGSMLVKRRGG